MFTAAGRLATVVGSEPQTDPFIANVKLLMHFEDVNGGTNFVDQMGHPLTRVGSPVMSTTSPLYGTSSGVFTSTDPDYLTTPGSTDFVFPGDVTIEFTYKVGLSGVQQQLIGNLTGNTANHWAFRTTGANNSVVWWANGLTGAAGSFGVYTAGTILKIALVRSGSSCTVFVNGIAVGSVLTFSGTMGLAGTPLAIGAVSNGTVPFGGTIDEIRITQGVARYLSNYTPRKTPFPNV